MKAYLDYQSWATVSNYRLAMQECPLSQRPRRRPYPKVAVVDFKCTRDIYQLTCLGLRS